MIYENFTINADIHTSKRAIIVDNFYNDPDSVRAFALRQEYEPSNTDNPYIGSRTYNQFLFEGIKESFETILNQKITKWDEYGMNGRFQHNTAGQPLVYHCDAQQWAAMIYLTPDAPPECGTSTYMHKETKQHHNSQFTWGESGTGYKVFPGDTFLDKTRYETVDVFGNIYNRLVIFDGGCIHAASEYFGSNKENCRLWHMFFFDT